MVFDASEEKPYKRAVKGIESLRGQDIIVYTKEEFEGLRSDISTLCHKIRKWGRWLQGF